MILYICPARRQLSTEAVPDHHLHAALPPCQRPLEVEGIQVSEHMHIQTEWSGHHGTQNLYLSL